MVANNFLLDWKQFKIWFSAYVFERKNLKSWNNEFLPFMENSIIHPIRMFVIAFINIHYMYIHNILFNNLIQEMQDTWTCINALMHTLQNEWHKSLRQITIWIILALVWFKHHLHMHYAIVYYTTHSARINILQHTNCPMFWIRILSNFLYSKNIASSSP